MATQFEVALWGGGESRLRAAADEALEEIRRLDAQLSRYSEESDIALVNARAAHETVPVEPRLFRLLERCAQLTEQTAGAFDVTVGPLLQAWGFVGGSGAMPTEAEVEAARQVTGMSLVELDAAGSTVRFRREGVGLDLGAVGKGYAIEQAADILRACGIGGALIHGGTSTVQTVGSQENGEPWPIAVRDPSTPDGYVAVAPLRDLALSVSAAHGKSFREGDARYGHVLDPTSGRPARRALLAAVVCGSAADSDALSTALLVQGAAFLDRLDSVRPGAHGLVVAARPDGPPSVFSRGDWGLVGP